MRRGTRVTCYRRGLYWNAEDQESSKLLQGMAVPSTLETDCWTIHQESACGKHAQTEQVIKLLQRAMMPNLFADFIFRLMVCHVFTNFTIPFCDIYVSTAITTRSENRKFRKHFKRRNILRDKITWFVCYREYNSEKYFCLNRIFDCCFRLRQSFPQERILF